MTNHFIDQLPRIVVTWHGRVRISEREFGLCAIVLKHRRSWNQRELAQLAGYADVSGLNRALHSMKVLGILALSTSRGRNGSTVAWIRREVRAVGYDLGEMLRPVLRTKQLENRSDTGGNIYGPQGGLSSLGSIIGGLAAPLRGVVAQPLGGQP